jgi:outer membrane receptor for ferrienterochelin and colicins
MRYKGLRWTVGSIYKFNSRNSLQIDLSIDRFRYGKEYDVPTDAIPVGTYVQSKKQRTIERQVKAILGIVPQGTTIVGSDWQLDKLVATSGNIDQESYILAYYVQHEQRFLVGNGTLLATLGARYNYHKTFGNHFTPKASLMYSLGHVNLRATWSAGFRAPGLDELYYHYFSVNRGKPQISFGNKSLKPEKSNYLSLNAEYRNDALAVSVTGYLNRINDMVVKHNIDVDDPTRQMLMKDFPEMPQEQAAKLVSYARYQNSDKGDVKGLNVNISANILRGFNLTVNYAYTHARTKSGEEWTVLERSIRHAATIAANYRHSWGRYALNVNLNGRLQSTTYYTGSYDNAPGFGIWNLNTTHRFDIAKWACLEPRIGIDNIFDRVDRRIDSSTRKYALYTPGRMFVVGLKVTFKN